MSSRGVVEAHLARIDDVNGSVNAVTVVLRGSALAAADAATAADSGAVRGPFHGVPFTVKENIDCPVVIGPTWTQLPWPVDADLRSGTGVRLVLDTVRFVTPGNVLGLPSVSLPTGAAYGLPTGIQIYSDLWREYLVLGGC